MSRDGPVAGPLAIYGRVMVEARDYWWHLGGLLLLSLLSTPLTLLAPLPVAIAVDNVLGPHPPPGFLDTALPPAATSSPEALLWVAVGLVLAVALLSRLRSLAKGVLKIYTGERLVLDVRARLLAQAQRLSLRYHDDKGAAESTYRIHHDASAIKSLATGGVIPFISSTVQLVTMVVVIAAIDVQLALIALAIIPALFLALRANAHRLRGGWHGVKKLDSSIMSAVQEVLGGLRVVKAFGQEERERARYLQRGSEKARARTRLAVLENVLTLLIGLIVAGGTAAVLYIGVTHVREGVLTLGSLLLVLSYLSSMYRPLEAMSEKIAEVQSSLVSAERAFWLLDEPQDVPESPNPKRLPRASGAVAFEEVSFAYGDGTPVLSRLEFAVAPGTRLGIVGATGAGKTTLVNLLTRFFDPTEGRILLDGVDLREYKLADLRNQFAIVLQDPVLFSASIAENIAYARPGASEKEIVAAARVASAHEFISELPEGYQTTVGERGMRLSGGERQRISLARAFLKDAPILILDEPTSSVDVETERQIMIAMRRLMQGRTSLMITHRLTTLSYCTQLLTVAGGRLVERSGTGQG